MRAVDLFAGFSGASTGAKLAGAKVVYAANHWPVAVETHKLNHPETIHVCQDLRQADWTALPQYDLLIAGPSCQGNSVASQANRRPKHDVDRATAWAVVDCAEVTEPRALIVENVLPMRDTWPLYSTWKQALRKLGFTLTEHIVCATNHGVPQRRERLFIVGTRNGSTPPLFKLRGPEPAFGPCLEDIQPDRLVSDAGEGRRERIRVALKRSRGAPILSHDVTGHRGIPLTEPIRTITCQDQWTVAEVRNGTAYYRPLTKREYARAQSFPDSFVWPEELSRADVVRGIGNAWPVLVARDVVKTVMEAA